MPKEKDYVKFEKGNDEMKGHEIATRIFPDYFILPNLLYPCPSSPCPLLALSWVEFQLCNFPQQDVLNVPCDLNHG